MVSRLRGVVQSGGLVAMKAGMNEEQRAISSSVWAIRIALFCAALVVLTIIFHRIFGMATAVALNLFALSFAGCILVLLCWIVLCVGSDLAPRLAGRVKCNDSNGDCTCNIGVARLRLCRLRGWARDKRCHHRHDKSAAVHRHCRQKAKRLQSARISGREFR